MSSIEDRILISNTKKDNNKENTMNLNNNIDFNFYVY